MESDRELPPNLPHRYADRIESVLITADEIDVKLDELAKRLDEDYADREILFVGVLKGAFVLMADLLRRLSITCTVDFMAVSSYGSGSRTSGVVRILKDLDTDIEGRDVVLVEDIVDSGLTLDYLVKNLRSRRPASFEILTLLAKPAASRVHVPIRYCGFEIPDVFVVGYGLDLAQEFRNLPFIATLSQENL